MDLKYTQLGNLFFKEYFFRLVLWRSDPMKHEAGRWNRFSEDYSMAEHGLGFMTDKYYNSMNTATDFFL